MDERSRSYRDELLESLKDPCEAAAYLHAAREESHEALVAALKNVSDAHKLAMAENQKVKCVEQAQPKGEKGI